MQSQSTATAKEKKDLIVFDKDGLTQKMGESRKIFIADDDDNYTTRVSTALKMRGFETEVVNSFAEMTATLQKKQYPINFIDNIEGNPGTSKGLTGSEIILEKPDLFRNAKRIILLTGWEIRQDVRNQLQKQGVEILKKDINTLDNMVGICKETFSADTESIINNTKDYFELLLEDYKDTPKLERKFRPYEKLIERTKLRFKNYINTLPNPDTPQFYVMGKSLSPKEIISEIEEPDSEVGVLLIDILLDDVLEGDDD